LVSSVPNGLNPMACKPEEQVVVEEEAGDMDDLMAEMRREAELEQKRKDEATKQAAEDAKRLKQQRDLDNKKKREEMNKVADEEAKKKSFKKSEL